MKNTFPASHCSYGLVAPALSSHQIFTVTRVTPMTGGTVTADTHAGNCFSPRHTITVTEDEHLLQLRPTCAVASRIITRHRIPRKSAKVKQLQPTQSSNSFHVLCSDFPCISVILCPHLGTAPTTFTALLLENVNSVLSTHQRTGEQGNISTSAL